MKWHVPGAIITDTAALALFVLWGSVHVPPAPPVPPVESVSFQAVGDSLTSWEGLELTGAPRVDVSWIDTATSDSVSFTGGWARGGAESGDMFAHLPDITADVLVILAGTNDINHSKPQGDTLSYIQMMGAFGHGHVVLVAAPPNTAHIEASVALNSQIDALAQANGWTFVDPWVTFRAADGGWVTGASPDGVHPERYVADRVGQILNRTILAAA